MNGNDNWREQYRKVGQREFIETEKYKPCPGSTPCHIVTMQADGEPLPDAGPTWPNKIDFEGLNQ